ncbi:50S ribosomal protein L25 [Buchnera aphidicola (Kurisakia onigurumii)]|uniref:50S ribosomal protein L25 n=1 Tax=Buchnera aphidicola TaxID=9 RepID=UPI0031B6EA5D
MLTIFAEKRTKLGKSASRLLRKNNKFPSIIYGLDIVPVYIEINQDAFINMMSIPDFNKKKIIIQLDNNLQYHVKIKDLQNHAFKRKILHIDFFVQK